MARSPGRNGFWGGLGFVSSRWLRAVTPPAFAAGKTVSAGKRHYIEQMFVCQGEAGASSEWRVAGCGWRVAGSGERRLTPVAPLSLGKAPRERGEPFGKLRAGGVAGGRDMVASLRQAACVGRTRWDRVPTSKGGRQCPTLRRAQGRQDCRAHETADGQRRRGPRTANGSALGLLLACYPHRLGDQVPLLPGILERNGLLASEASLRSHGQDVPCGLLSESFARPMA